MIIKLSKNDPRCAYPKDHHTEDIKKLQESLASKDAEIAELKAKYVKDMKKIYAKRYIDKEYPKMKRIEGNSGTNFLKIENIDKENFMEKVSKLESCWEWTGCINRSGYGVYRRFKAHRISYTIFKKDIPPKMTIDHICKNRKCVNPEHLKEATYWENNQNRRPKQLLQKIGEK